MPTTTLGSTMPTSVIELHVPLQWQDQLIADLDRLQAQDTADAALLAEIARLRPDDAHARASRTAAIETAIETAIEEKRAILEAKHQCFRTSTLRKYIGKRDDREPPTREVIQRVLKKHGLYT